MKNWGQMLTGTAMLLAVLLVVLIRLVNSFGIGKGLGLMLLGILFVVWLVTGTLLLCKGLSKYI